MGNWLDFIILGLATWRLSSLLVQEPGPGDILEKLRSLIGVRYDEWSNRVGRTPFASLFTCIWCMSVWVALGLSLLALVLPWLYHGLAYCLAGSALAILINKQIGEHG